ncbi:hypothetical protein [Scytonema sp. PCC 10023]|uniref:hypothetical protein n=1 Tax=Scytonema sp. PCC 10023 TaxID=1680591 RepID=UPI0039C68FA2
MIINDLSQLEIVAEEAKEVQGGFQYHPQANANASAFAFASGNYFATTYTTTYTNALSYSNVISGSNG